MFSTLRGCARRFVSSPLATFNSKIYGFSESVSSVQKIQRSRRNFESVWEGGVQSIVFIFAITAASGIVGGSCIMYADIGQKPSPIVGKFEEGCNSDKRKKKVVVLGSGWAGVSFLKTVDTSLYDVHVISPRNFFVFTPLLPSVTAGTVEARSITESIRKIVQKKLNVKFSQANCIGINAESRRVFCRPVADQLEFSKSDFEVEYDYLVIAVGARANTFNTPGVEEYCHFLKEIEDAEKIRESIVDCFELAALPFLSEDERRQLLHFVTVGGGPTGVEFAAELHDLVYEDLCKLYPDLIPFVNIVVIQSGDHILNTFDERISEFAEQKFRRDGIEIKTGCRVLEVGKKSIVMKEKSSGKKVEVPYGMAVWSTGIGTRPVIADFMNQIGQSDRRALVTDEWLRVKGCEDTYALGDCATIEQRKLLEDVAYIFALADKDKSGNLTAKEFKDALELIRERYPQIDLYLDRQHLKGVMKILDDPKTYGEGDTVLLDIEQFKKALTKVDAQMKTLPATAQVAAQQGEYLAHCFNHRRKCESEPEGPMRVRGGGRHHFHPFIYKHFGMFAPLGGEQAAAELPGDWVSVGRSTQWLWYSVYAR